MSKKLEITLKRSTIGANESQVSTVRALGLKKINDTATHTDTPSVRGMINTVSHLLTIKEA